MQSALGALVTTYSGVADLSLQGALSMSKLRFVGAAPRRSQAKEESRIWFSVITEVGDEGEGSWVGSKGFHV